MGVLRIFMAVSNAFVTHGCAVAEKEGGSFPWAQGPGFHLFCVDPLQLSRGLQFLLPHRVEGA